MRVCVPLISAYADNTVDFEAPRAYSTVRGRKRNNSLRLILWLCLIAHEDAAQWQAAFVSKRHPLVHNAGRSAGRPTYWLWQVARTPRHLFRAFPFHRALCSTSPSLQPDASGTWPCFRTPASSLDPWRAQPTGFSLAESPTTPREKQWVWKERQGGVKLHHLEVSTIIHNPRRRAGVCRCTRRPSSTDPSSGRSLSLLGEWSKAPRQGYPHA